MTKDQNVDAFNQILFELESCSSFINEDNIEIYSEYFLELWSSVGVRIGWLLEAEMAAQWEGE